MKKDETPDYHDSLADIARQLHKDSTGTQIRGFHFVIPPHVMRPKDASVNLSVFFVTGDEAPQVGELIGQYVDALAEHANRKSVAAHSPS